MLYKTFCCVCSKIFETKVPPGKTKNDFCSEKCWYNASTTLTDKVQ